ncbi:MAG: hypothetical protein IKF70_03250 [Firmicutes bacterium]|nr:hypothetical protein [Bacillota bacterium]
MRSRYAQQLPQADSRCPLCQRDLQDGRHEPERYGGPLRDPAQNFRELVHRRT